MFPRCAQCQLPIRGRPLRMTVADAVELFCCYGCYVVLCVTRERGPGGEAHAIVLRLGLAVFFAMNAMMFSLPGYFPYVYGAGADGAVFLAWLRWLALLMTLPVLLLLGLPVLWQALRDAAQWIARTDALVAIGCIAAFAVSVHHTITGAPHVYFDSVAMLLVLITLGRYLEARAKADTGAALAAIEQTLPRAVRVERDGAVLTVSPEALCVGDLVCLSPGDMCPVDGIIISGRAGFSDATLTGEVAPAVKAPGATVLAGSTNLDGHVRIRSHRVGRDCTVGRLTESVETALAQQTRLQRVADHLAALLLVATPLVAAASALYWLWYGTTDDALLASVSVLVVACPCAFGVATPAALSVGIAVAARRHVLVRGAAVLEALSRVRTVWFDKTGTLSTGRLVLVEIRLPPQHSTTAAEVLSIARALEAGLSHPIAAALGGEVDVHPLRATDVRYHAGLGIEGRVGGHRWYLGSSAFLQRLGVSPPSWVAPPLVAPSGMRTLLAAGPDDGGPIDVRALLHFADEARPEMQTTFEQLRTQGVRVGVLSGGSAPAAEWTALLDGVEAHVGLLPEEKVAHLRRLGGVGLVAMVGDGLNDAPALASADVGIALGTGTDLTRQAAAVSVLSNDLSAVPWLLAWSRRVRRTVHVNLAWAVVYNALALAAAAGGHLNPIIAALAMIGSSLLIVSTTARLHRAGTAEPIAISPSAQPLAVGPAVAAPVAT